MRQGPSGVLLAAQALLDPPACEVLDIVDGGMLEASCGEAPVAWN